MAGVEWNIIGRKMEPKQKLKKNKSDFDHASFKIQKPKLLIETIINFLIKNIIIPVVVASRYTKFVVVVD